MVNSRNEQSYSPAVVMENRKHGKQWKAKGKSREGRRELRGCEHVVTTTGYGQELDGGMKKREKMEKSGKGVKQWQGRGWEETFSSFLFSNLTI